MSEIIKQDETTKEPQNLKEFVDDNQKVIAVIGVFYALAVLWKSLSPGGAVSYVAFLCLFVTIPLFIEVRREYRPKDASLLLILFMDGFMGVFILTALHVLIEHWRDVARYIWGAILLFAAVFIYVGSGYLASKIKDWRYNRTVKWREKLLSLGLPRDQTDERVEIRNRALKGFYRSINGLRYILLAVLLFPFLVLFAESGKILHATFDVIFDQNLTEVVEPVQDLPTP